MDIAELKEVLEREIVHLEEKVKLEREAEATARKIASDELARRLEILNGEAGRLAKMQETYYPRQVAEPRLDQIEKELREMQLSAAVLSGKASQGSFLLTLSLAVVGVLLSLYNTFGVGKP